MSIPIILFHHCVFQIGDAVLPNAWNIITSQMSALKLSGLEGAASEIHIGVNGGTESEVYALASLPWRAKIVYHGLQCRNENRTIVMIEEWLKANSGEAYILYQHSKGVTHSTDDPLRTPWANCMTKRLVWDWGLCVAALQKGFDAAGCHYMQPPMTPATQYILAGNFWWARASFLRTLPSIYERERIKVSGIDNIESRYESEVWIGNGPRPPRVMDFCPNWNPGKPHS